MRTVLLFLTLPALCCTVSSSPPSPFNVFFSSVNLWNVLRWFPGNDTQDDTHYTVQYAIYGDSVEGSKGKRVNWRAVRHCTEIVRSWCDLTAETWGLEEGYHARVRAVGRRASSKWAMTRRRFDPKLDTTFGPPLISLQIEDNSAIINLKGPMRYLPNNQTPGVSMETLYPQMTYNLSIYNTRRDKTNHFPVVSSPYKYSLMEYDTEFCFSAKTRFLSMPIECQSSEWHCITTPQDPVIGQLQRVVVGIVVPSVCMCMLMVVGYLLYQYLTGKGQKSPYNLDLNPPSFHPPPLTFPPENLNLILITVIKDEPPSVADSAISKCAFPDKRQAHIADPPLSYAPQRSRTPPEPEEHLDDFSVDYGSVVEDWRHGGGEGGSNLRGERHKAGESYKNEEWRFKDDCPAGVYTSQSHSQTEMSTLVQAQAWSQVNPVLLTQTQASLQVDSEREDRERLGLCVNKNQLSQIPLNQSTRWEGGMRVGTDRKIDEGAGEGSERENVSLLWAYASQNIKNMSTPHADQSDFLSGDYGVLRALAEEEEEEEDGSISIDWDPETKKLVLPKIEMAFNKEGGLDGLMQGERGREDRMGGEEEEEEEMMKDELRLESVFVRQASEEEAQRGVETGWEVDDIMSKWNLVISMDR